MQYMLLICAAEGAGPAMGSPEMAELMQAYGAFTEEVKNAGVYVDGNPLQDIDTATTVRVRGGKVEMTDGPFAETKEHLGGYYILDCANLDDALGYAAKIPTAAYGSIEVRPVMVMDM